MFLYSIGRLGELLIALFWLLSIHHGRIQVAYPVKEGPGATKYSPDTFRVVDRHHHGFFIFSNQSR